MYQRFLTALILVTALMLGGLAEAKTPKPAKSGHHAVRPAKSKTKSVKHSIRKASTRRRSVRKVRGQQAINPERVREIQAALIRFHYLDGEADGVWDTRSKKAMQQFQADNGWQSKVVPDSRALIKLGLGPDHTGLLNPETAAIQQTSQPVPGGGAQ